jgi:hypothetical protein
MGQRGGGVTAHLRIIAVILLGGPLCASVHAQSWLPEKGSASLSVAYSNDLNEKHYLPDGGTVDVGHTRTQTLGITGSYALSDRLLITGGIPFVTARYRGDFPHPTKVDDGHYHGSTADLRLGLHFQALLEPVLLAPYIAVVIPSRSYVTLGHATPGRGLEEAWFGFYAGKSLDEWIPRTYLQTRYNYALVEKVAGVSHNRSNVELEIGYFLNARASVRTFAAWQETHGGIDVPVPGDHPLFDHHDQLAADSFLNLGGGFSYSLSQRLSVYSVYLSGVRGRNGHKVEHSVTLGVNYLVAAP